MAKNQNKQSSRPKSWDVYYDRDLAESVQVWMRNNGVKTTNQALITLIRKGLGMESPDPRVEELESRLKALEARAQGEYA